MMLRMSLALRGRLPVTAMVYVDLRLTSLSGIRGSGNVGRLLMRQRPALQAALAAVLSPILAAFMR